jgi:hypothetical protein
VGELVGSGVLVERVGVGHGSAAQSSRGTGGLLTSRTRSRSTTSGPAELSEHRANAVQVAAHRADRDVVPTPARATAAGRGWRPRFRRPDNVRRAACVWVMPPLRPRLMRRSAATRSSGSAGAVVPPLVTVPVR